MNEDHIEGRQGPVIVRRAVHTAASLMEKEALKDKRNLTDWNLAQEQRDLFRQDNDNEMADFWHEVYLYLMTLECVDCDAEIRVID